MSRPLKQFWSALEQLPDLAGVPSEWRALLGDDHAAVLRFMLPTKRIAGSMGATAPGRTCIHEIREWKGQYLTVCPDGCDTVKLPRDEVVVHRLDVAALAREIAAVLGLADVSVEPMSDLASVWRIGDYFPLSGYRFPAYLTLTGEPDHLRCVIDGLGARNEPFILLAPTRSALRQATAASLKRVKSCFLALGELLGLRNDGQFALLDGHTDVGVFAEFRGLHVPQTNADDGMVFFPTPPGAQWGDLTIVFKDTHTVSVSVGEIQRMLNYTAMGMANRKTRNPNKQWDLLYEFALGNGRLALQSRKRRSRYVSPEDLTDTQVVRRQPSDPGKTIRKQKQVLAKSLQKFFRIDGDPFILANEGGWRARFTVTTGTGHL